MQQKITPGRIKAKSDYMYNSLFLLFFLCGLLNPIAQTWNQSIINSSVDGATSVFAVDLDSDSDNDVISASSLDSTIAWYENLGNGNFGPQQIISNHAKGAECVFACDLDGDLIVDVLSASSIDNKIAWYKNLGNGNFGPQQVLSNNTIGAESIFAEDTDNDGDLDILSSSRWDNSFSWFENLGNGIFGARHIISSSLSNPRKVIAADLDNDGDQDVIGVTDSYVVWFENQGNNTFGSSQQLHYLFYMVSASVIDIDNDGDLDIAAISLYETAFLENLGNGIFAAAVLVNTSIGGVDSQAEDIDHDGFEDLIVANSGLNSIFLYKNDGNGGFLSPQTIPGSFNDVRSVYCTDLDSDGTLDLLSCSYADDEITWNKNQLSSTVSEFDFSSLLVYPNPLNTNTLTLELEKGEVIKKIEWFDALGKPCSFDVTYTKEGIQINVKEHCKGISTLRISFEDKIISKKIIVI